MNLILNRLIYLAKKVPTSSISLTLFTLLILTGQQALAKRVDLLLLYDDYTENRYRGDPSAAMTAWVENANLAYQDSQVDIQLRLVGLVKYTPNARSMRDKLYEIGRSAEVNALRNQYGADFVALIASRDGNICGIGNFAVNARYAFNVTGAQCGYLTLVHELGHNMGLGHSRKQGDSGGARYGYGLGYGVNNVFSTIMAYPQAFNSRRRLNRFSDPERTCEGYPCGVQAGSPNQADAHRALNNVSAEVANFRRETTGGGQDVIAPSNLNLRVSSNSSINISWQTNNSGANSYELQRSTASSGFQTITTTTQNNYVDNGLSSATRYSYRVRAIKNGKASNWSSAASATTTGQQNIPAPSNLTAAVASDNTINLSWSDNSYNEDYFQIERALNRNGPYSEIARPARGRESHSDQNLSPNTYFYRTRAHKNGRNSSWSNTVSATITEKNPTEPTDGDGINLQDLRFTYYSREIGRDARAYYTDEGKAIAMQNNVWVASREYVQIDTDSVLHFDYSSNVSGEIHGIGFDENNTPSRDRIFKLGGSQNWGIDQYSYTGNGDVQSFQIPIGQYYTGRMRLVMANDNDAGSGNTSYFGNIRIVNASGDVSNVYTDFTLGLRSIDDTSAQLYYKATTHLYEEVQLCIDQDCDTAELQHGFYVRDVNATADESYLIDFKALNNSTIDCSRSIIVHYNAEDVGSTFEDNCQ